METIRIRIGKRRRRRRGPALLFSLLLIIGFIIGGSIIWMTSKPNTTHVKPDYGSPFALFYQGQRLDQDAIMDGDELKLPLKALKQVLGENGPIRYESASGSIILTTSDHVLRMKTDELTATLNRKPYELRVTAEKRDKDVYLPVAPLTQLYGLQVEYKPDSGTVTLLQAGDAADRGKPTNPAKGAAIRTKASIRAPIVEQVEGTSLIRIWKMEPSNPKWYIAQGPDGAVGYVRATEINQAAAETVPMPDKPKPFVAPKLEGGLLNLTWEAVYDNPTVTSKIGPMPGVSVVSPTWFELQNGSGEIKSKASAKYVQWAHARGMQVWALFSNGFEPERTTKALATVETRFKMIQQLLAFAQLYDLQGINIDFENVNLSDKANLVQFMRELTPLLHEQGLVVSIDVSPKSTSPTWSMFLDRKSLGKIVDYMMLMAYDEHWATSPEAGSVASLSWTEESIARILEEDDVPANKLVLSMPLYTRLWTEKDDKVSSKAIGMQKAADIVKEHKLKPVLDEEAGQRYVEYVEDGAKQRIWLEDDYSIKARIALMHKYGLAGVATWQRAFQAESIWTTIDQTLKATNHKK
ncbi:glycoside hydrolase family 18 [Paenibacillus curdlanolyticus YK9]|uniref:Glycoside hydrolase family 18 n=1 Tax=Paenibacillus curdlanolyticus YK9 TaxID=717606 RepID=E0I6Z9_9BACL|nr:glycosyl hydrolase family 18 protein [Paenibacillus curdlanolyticus]EFM11815.1 glycoside hydrolase family 18 [Paenibacillus curdlanolyticus YK9]